MGFAEFVGNERIVAALRQMLASGRIPHALLFTGPRGVGKYLLARMFAQAANCERLADDFCGECVPCRGISGLAEPGPLIEAGLAERGESPDAATVERIPLILQTHPDVWVLVPDPVRLHNPVAWPAIRMGQLRAVQRAAYFRPLARRRVFIIDGAETMRWDYANIFLKVLEEPPETATLILLAPTPDALLPTIQSRCLKFHFAPLTTEQVERLLKEKTSLKPAERRLAAQLAAGRPGVAMTMDLEESARLRRNLLELIEAALTGEAGAETFALTDQLSRRPKEGLENLLELFYSLLRDLLELSCDPNGASVRNPDLRAELERVAPRVTVEWVARATEELDKFHTRLRRNINRQLGLDAWVAASAAR
ncbi:MAG: DNA polymerase III subunit delta' [Acidobacteriia bacterium]|nr:DNA polymerase III subunit delta' [Terriglobia bacterium]